MQATTGIFFTKEEQKRKQKLQVNSDGPLFSDVPGCGESGMCHSEPKKLFEF